MLSGHKKKKYSDIRQIYEDVDFKYNINLQFKYEYYDLDYEAITEYKLYKNKCKFDIKFIF